MKKLQQGYTTLVIMFALAAVFLTVGFLVIRNNTTPETESEQVTDTEEITNEEPKEVKEEKPSETLTIPSDWKVYTNAKYGYQVSHPSNLKVGTVSGNSSLGTFQVPVRGFDIGPLVFVTLTGDLRQEGADYFNSSYAVAVNPPPPMEGAPVVDCKIDKISNPATEVKSVTCTGEGGPARYALIKGTDYDIFVDGYSKGFDESDNGELKDEDDYIKILSSFRFKTETPDQSSSSLVPVVAAAEKSTLAVQSFSITADKTGVTPSIITVPKGTIVNLTFNVAADLVDGLEFKSSIANTGKIPAGSSKTIAFTVASSFDFSANFAEDETKKTFKISVVAE